jgi:superfamily II DNA or RNA helicase
MKVIKKHLVFQPETPGQIKTLFPDAKFAGEYCAIPHTLDAAKVLNNIGLKAPSPIRTEYDWPSAGGRYVPRWYQIDTADFFTLNPRCHCHNAPRTGKTNSTLWAADYLRRKGVIKSTLIIAPLSCLWDVWEKTIFECLPLRTFTVIYGSRQKRLELLAKPSDFYIINHHGVGIIEHELAKRPDINHIVYDEVAVMRNGGKRRKPDAPESVIFDPINRIANEQGIQRSLWGLTGTPTPNAPTDAYGQSKLITPWHVRGTSFSSFRLRTMHKLGDFKWVPMRGAMDTAAKVLKPSIRFERTVCTDMEPCHVYRRAELSAQQQRTYKALISKALAEIEGQTVTAINAAVLLSKITQIASGCVLDVNKEVVSMDFGPRYAVLEELIEENDEKVLVFAPFTAVLNDLAEKLRKRWSVEIIYGDVSPTKRNKIFSDFRRNKDPHILVCHPGTMQHGLDLTSASLAIWYAPTVKAEEYQQANARIDGSRQTAKIDIAHIYATSEEQRIYNVLQGKGKLQDIVLSMSNDR